MGTAKRMTMNQILIMVGCAGAMLSATASANAVKPVMKDMKNHYNAAMASQSMPEFQRYETAFQNDVAKAGTLSYSADQATYQRGVKELQNGLQSVQRAMQANDLNGAKQAMSQLSPIKKHYHKLLN